MILLITSSLLFLFFLLHLIWWRIKVPSNATITLLAIFLGGLICAWAINTFLFPMFSLSIFEIMQIVLLYLGCVMVYIIVYSALEQQSPTLALISYFNRNKEIASDFTDSILQNLHVDNEMKKRLLLMEQGGWMFLEERKWHLTKKGKRIGIIFEYAAVIFGLKKGG